MSAPLTPHGRPGQGEKAHRETPHGDIPHGPGRQPAQPAGDMAWSEYGGPGVKTEIRQAALVAAGITVAGVLLGLLWLWLAPRIPLVSNGEAVYFKNSEGEEAIGADGTFALLALGFGVLTAAVVFWFFRQGGVPLVIGIAVGGLLASVLAWRLGVWLGPPQDVAAHARAIGEGRVFDAPLQLRAKGVLLAWPMAAAVAHLALTALFGPRDPYPGPDAAL